MKYLSNYELEEQTITELLEYRRLLKEKRKILFAEAQTWSDTAKAVDNELKNKLQFLEEEVILAELDRLENDLAFNDTLREIN